MIVTTPNLKEKKIYHVIVDDKFIDTALRQFEEVAQNKNIPLILGRQRNLRFVKSKNVIFCSHRKILRIIRSNECTAVILHSLPEDHLFLLENLPAKTKVFWLGWGYDYYDRLLKKPYPSGLLLPETKRLLGEITSSDSISSKIRSIINAGIKSISKPSPTTAVALSRIDYFSPVLKVEYEMAREHNPWFNPKFISWNYGTAEDDLGGATIEFGVPRKNILIGNSAAPENNHIEIFKLLKANLDLTNRKIIVPLSYGCTKYRRKILQIGHETFGDNFIGLIDFISIEKYIEILDSCGFVFMNHLRQQAMGNIFIMMMKGTTIYMNSQNPAFKWLKSKGAMVYPLDSIEKQGKADFFKLEPISETDHKKNIEVTMSHCGREVQNQKTIELIKTAIG